MAPEIIIQRSVTGPFLHLTYAKYQNHLS